MILDHHLTLASPGDQVMRGLYVGEKFSTLTCMMTSGSEEFIKNDKDTKVAELSKF